MISASPESLEAAARRLQQAVGGRGQVESGLSTVGGGSLPGGTLPTRLLALTADGLPGGAQGLARRLREAETPVIARIEDGRVVIDPRTVAPRRGGRAGVFLEDLAGGVGGDTLCRRW